MVFILRRVFKYCGHKPIMTFFAVVKGRKLGIYDSWAKCKANIDGFPEASFEFFPTEDEAIAYCESKGVRILPNLMRIKKDFTPETIEIMESDDDSKEECRAVGRPTDHKPLAESHSFDFTSFSLRLSRLEETYLQKMKELENRIEALEAARLASDIPDSPIAVKRTFSQVDLRANSSNKKSKNSTKLQIDSYEFDLDEDGYVKVYTDGACSANGHGNAKAGVGVWFGANHPLNISEPVSGRATNNMAEIQAATWAIQQAIRVGVKKICVFTDSQFLINCITKWIKGWKRNGWKTKAKEDIKNREELEVLDKVVRFPGVNVKWEYVQGHSNNKGNDGADSLACQGALRYQRDKIADYPWLHYFAT